MQRMINGELVEVFWNSSAPSGASQAVASSGQVANAQAAATLPAVAGKTTHVTGIQITGGGATVAAIVAATLSGLAGGSLTYIYGAVAGALLQSQALVVTFDPPLPASAVNTAITLTLPALGAGNTAAVANITGYYI